MEQNNILESQFQRIDEFMYGKLKSNKTSIIKPNLKIMHNIDRFKTIIYDLIEFNKLNKISDLQSYLDKISTELPQLKLYNIINPVMLQTSLKRIRIT